MIKILSERVADGEVEGEGFAEATHVVVAALARVVGGVDTYAEVAADNEHADVEAQAYTGAEGEGAQESLGLERASGTHGVVFEQPYIAGVNKERAMERAHNGEAIFYIGLEFKCTRAVEVVFRLSGRCLVAARTYRADRKGAD